MANGMMTQNDQKRRLCGRMAAEVEMTAEDREKLRRKLIRASLCMTRQCWEQGILAYALYQTGENELAEAMADDMVIRQSTDGRLCNVEDTPAVTDSAFCIPVVWQLGKRENGGRYREAAEKNIRYFLYDAERTEDGVLYHMRGTRQVWADSAAFLPYSLALTGHPEEACRQMKGLLACLCIPETGLYGHIRDMASGSFVDGRPWGVGNGWILTGLLRTALQLPASQGREELILTFRQLLRRMMAYQDADGGFHDDLTDPDSFEETETTAMVALSIREAGTRGILDAAEMRAYAQAEQNMRTFVLDRIDEQGRATGSSGSPSFDHPGTSVESQAHVIMLL